MHSYLPTPSHLGEFVITAGHFTAGVTNEIFSFYEVSPRILSS